MNTHQINEYWRLMESNYKGKRFNNNQKQILDIAMDFHKCLIEGYTGYGLKEEEALMRIRRLREENSLYSKGKRFQFIQGKVLPERITSYEMAYAWVMSIGDNDSLLYKLFPNRYEAGYPKVKRYWGDDIDSFTGVITPNTNYLLLMAIFAYIASEADDTDKILKIKINIKSGMRYIKVHTKYYSIEINYTKGCQNYYMIQTRAKRSVIL